MNRIFIYGPGCAKCTALAEVTKQAMQELHLEAPMEKVTDAMLFATAGVWVTPALAVDGRVLVSGTVPSKDEIRRILQDALDGGSTEKECCCSGPEDSNAVKGEASRPEDHSCGCNAGGCCSNVSAGRCAGWKKAVVWVVALLILLAAVKMINHRTHSGNGEPSRTAVSAER